jgi:hypothetical protein
LSIWYHYDAASNIMQRDTLLNGTRITYAPARGTKLGRPALELSTKATKTLRRFVQAREKSPRPSYRSLATALEVSVGKAHALTRGLAERRKPELHRGRSDIQEVS